MDPLKNLVSSNGGTRTARVAVVPSLVDNLFSGGDDGVKHREGGRVRAWREAFECAEKANAEGWDMETLLTYMASVRDGVAASPTGKSKAKGRYLVGLTAKGNYIYQNGGSDDTLTELFVSVYSYKTKAGALYAIDHRDFGNGVKVF